MSYETDNFDALFNPEINTKKASTASNLEYKPQAKNGKNNVYQSVVRFITWWQAPNQSIINKWQCWLVDPITNNGKMIDCPSSVGKQSPLLEMYSKLKKSESVAMQQKAQIFSRRSTYSALIQVIKDENNPDLVGKILVWNFGKKIYDKIDAELNPIFGDKHNPFDLINGKLFTLHISLVSGYNNYDNCKFVDKSYPILMPNNEGRMSQINENVSKREVFEYLKTNSPDLSKYAYREWDNETHNYVNHVIAAVTGKAAAPLTTAEVLNNTGSISTPDFYPNPGSVGISAVDLSVDDLPSMELPTMGDLPDINTSNSNNSMGNINDLLNGL